MSDCLKPCPFCGGEAYCRHPVREKGTAFDSMMVECKKCGAAPYAVNVYMFDDDDRKYAAIARLWNRRADVVPRVHAKWIPDGDKYSSFHKCSVCDSFSFREENSWGDEVNEHLTPFCPWCGAEMDTDT